jgi:DHA3 family macrolide efflux protein-like MFS transporter
MALLFYFGVVEIWHVYILMTLRAIGGAFHYPAQQASISLLVPNEHLARIAGLNEAIRGGINIIAPPLGALFLEFLDIQGTLSIDFLTAIIAVGILFFLHIPQPENRKETSVFHLSSLLSDMKEGMAYLLHWKGMVATIALALIMKIALSPAFSLLPLLVSDHFNGDAVQYALVESLSGIGLVLGGLILGFWGGFKKKVWTLWSAVAAMGICLFWISKLNSSQFTIFLIAIFIQSLIVPMIDGPFMAILQSNVKPEFQGRVISLTISLLWLSTPIGLGIAGPIADHFGIPFWFMIAGILSLFITMLGLIIPVVRNIEDNS